MLRYKLIITVFALLLLSVPFVSVSCSDDRNFVYSEGTVWNTFYHISFRGSPSLVDSIVPELEKVGRSVSVFDSSSLVSRVNATDSICVDEAFMAVYRQAKSVSEATGGIYDPTVSPLVDAWGFGRGHKMNADTARIDSLLGFVGIGKTSLKGDILIKEDRRICFNFSSIAKGFGCDCVAGMLRRNGVKDYMVEIGGEIACGGLNPNGKPWTIGVENPRASDGKEKNYSDIIEVGDCGVATSGNYRNFREGKDGRVGHIINPVSGRPAETDVASCTVVAPEAMAADAYATAFTAMGMKKAKELARKSPFAVMLIASDGSVWENSMFVSLRRKK